MDIEYGRDNPRFISHTPDPTTPGAHEAAAFYARAWRVYHGWIALKRSPRDCRVAELFAAQYADFGTVRGISRTLKAERLSPWSPGKVQDTLSEIRGLIFTGAFKDDSPIHSPIYLIRWHRAA